MCHGPAHLQTVHGNTTVVKAIVRIYNGHREVVSSILGGGHDPRPVPRGPEHRPRRPHRPHHHLRDLLRRQRIRQTPLPHPPPHFRHRQAASTTTGSTTAATCLRHAAAALGTAAAGPRRSERPPQQPASSLRRRQSAQQPNGHQRRRQRRRRTHAWGRRRRRLTPLNRRQQRCGYGAPPCPAPAHRRPHGGVCRRRRQPSYCDARPSGCAHPHAGRRGAGGAPGGQLCGRALRRAGPHGCFHPRSHCRQSHRTRLHRGSTTRIHSTPLGFEPAIAQPPTTGAAPTTEAAIADSGRVPELAFDPVPDDFVEHLGDLAEISSADAIAALQELRLTEPTLWRTWTSFGDARVISGALLPALDDIIRHTHGDNTDGSQWVPHTAVDIAIASMPDSHLMAAGHAALTARCLFCT